MGNKCVKGMIVPISHKTFPKSKRIRSSLMVENQYYSTATCNQNYFISRPSLLSLKSYTFMSHFGKKWIIGYPSIPKEQQLSIYSMIHNQNEKSEFAKKEKQTIPGINIKQKLTSFYTHTHTCNHLNLQFYVTVHSCNEKRKRKCSLTNLLKTLFVHLCNCSPKHLPDCSHTL